MDLDKLQIKANVRSGWQAIDLGFLMARRWWRALFMAATIPPLLLFIPLLVIFSDQPFWAVFIIWWLKPFWERLPLYLGSRRIFAEDTLENTVVSQFKKLFRLDFLPWLLWRRFSFFRAFDMPVSILEELKGKARARRLQVLHGKHTDIAFANQLVCFCCEVIVATGLFSIIGFFIPDSLELDVFDPAEDFTLFGEWVFSLCIFLATVLVIPFHSIAGLSLYLNRRMELEAWDIEITFRSLAQRKLRNAGNFVASILITLSLSFSATFLSTDSYAATQHDNNSAKELIDEVLKGNDFGEEKTIRSWRFRNLIEENEDRIPEWFIELVEWWENNVDLSDSEQVISSTAFWLKFLLIAFFIGLLIYLFYRFRGPLKNLPTSKRNKQAPDIMFGLDVRAESLPHNIPAQVMYLWQAQNHRDALSLLYRASLSRLIEHHALAFKASHTESECAELVKACGIASLSRYFSQLTQVWRRLAYGHQLPQLSTIETLCENWSKEMVDKERVDDAQ